MLRSRRANGIKVVIVDTFDGTYLIKIILLVLQTGLKKEPYNRISANEKINPFASSNYCSRSPTYIVVLGEVLFEVEESGYGCDSALVIGKSQIIFLPVPVATTRVWSI